jgi:hypothetical protein
MQTTGPAGPLFLASGTARRLPNGTHCDPHPRSGPPLHHLSTEGAASEQSSYMPTVLDKVVRWKLLVKDVANPQREGHTIKAQLPQVCDTRSHARISSSSPFPTCQRSAQLSSCGRHRVEQPSHPRNFNFKAVCPNRGVRCIICLWSVTSSHSHAMDSHPTLGSLPNEVSVSFPPSKT